MGEMISYFNVLLISGSTASGEEVNLISLKPYVGIILKYNPIVELLKREKQKVVIFKLGTKRRPIYNPDNKHYPFEKLGYIPNNNGLYD